MLRSLNEPVVPGWGDARVSGGAIHVILLSWWHLKTKGSVRPPTLSDLSPLKVKGFGLSHEDEIIVKHSGGRSTNHAVSYIPPNNGQSTFLQGLNVKKWVWQLNWFWMTEMSVWATKPAPDDAKSTHAHSHLHLKLLYIMNLWCSVLCSTYAKVWKLGTFRISLADSAGQL